MIIQTHSHSIYKFGRNSDTDTGDDIWDGSSAYPFPSAAATTTVASSSTSDTAAGTGARTVVVVGLDSSGDPVSETVTMDGTSNVTLSTDLLRVTRAYIDTVGSGGVNDGDIQVKHGATVLAQITADLGQTLMSVYTVPNNFYGWLTGWSVSADGSSAAKLALQTRDNGKGWRTRDMVLLDVSANSTEAITYQTWQRFEEMTDVRIRAISGGNNLDVVAQFTILLNSGSNLPTIQF